MFQYFRVWDRLLLGTVFGKHSSNTSIWKVQLMLNQYFSQKLRHKDKLDTIPFPNQRISLGVQLKPSSIVEGIWQRHKSVWSRLCWKTEQLCKKDTSEDGHQDWRRKHSTGKIFYKESQVKPPMIQYCKAINGERNSKGGDFVFILYWPFSLNLKGWKRSRSTNLWCWENTQKRDNNIHFYWSPIWVVLHLISGFQ